MLPFLFIALAALALMSSLYMLWQSLRAAFGVADPGALAHMVETEERATLLDEKSSLLRSIKDVEFEHELGKMSIEDFSEVDRKLRGRAREVLRLLDEEVEPFRKEAEKLVATHLKKHGGSAPYRDSKAGAKKAAAEPEEAKASRNRQCDGCGAKNDADAQHCTKCGERIVPQACPKCGMHNDSDAAFCKKCGTGLGAKSDSEGSEESGGDGKPSADTGRESKRAGGDEARASTGEEVGANAGSDDEAEAGGAGADAESSTSKGGKGGAS